MKDTKDNVATVDVETQEADAADDDQVKRATWRSLFNFTSRSHIVPLLLALVLSVVSGIIIPAVTVFLGKIFDSFTSFGGQQIRGPDLVKQVSTYALWLLGLGCTSGFLSGGFFMNWLVFGELQAKSAREKLFDGMLDKEMEWYDMRKAGIDTLTSRLQR